MTSAYEVFLKTDVSTYTGKWLAISDEGIVASGDSAKEVMERAMKLKPTKKITLVKVPEEETMIF